MALIRAVPLKLGVLGYDCSWPVQRSDGGHEGRESKVKRKEGKKSPVVMNQSHLVEV